MLAFCSLSRSQISFLHVYHHATTFFPVWALNVHYGPGGETYYCCALNSFVHVVMYGYYALAGLGVKVKAKKFVTQLQMVQFLTYIFQGSYDLITDCYKPRIQCVFVTVRETKRDKLGGSDWLSNSSQRYLSKFPFPLLHVFVHICRCNARSSSFFFFISISRRIPNPAEVKGDPRRAKQWKGTARRKTEWRKKPGRSGTERGGVSTKKES